MEAASLALSAARRRGSERGVIRYEHRDMNSRNPLKVDVAGKRHRSVRDTAQPVCSSPKEKLRTMLSRTQCNVLLTSRDALFNKGFVVPGWSS